MFARTKGFMNFMFNKKLLSVVESIVGPEITVNPIQRMKHIYLLEMGSIIVI